MTERSVGGPPTMYRLDAAGSLIKAKMRQRGESVALVWRTEKKWAMRLIEDRGGYIIRPHYGYFTTERRALALAVTALRAARKRREQG